MATSILISQTESLASTFQDPLVTWSIRLSIICMLLSLLCRSLQITQRCKNDTEQADEPPFRLDSNKPPIADEAGKHLWLLGALFSVLHTMATMLLIHKGSHVAAWEATADQTQQQLGVAVGFGIYFNYGFVILWCLDAFWWLGAEPSFLRRPRWITATINGFLIFIAFNGTVVFLNATSRWYWLAAWVILLIFWATIRTASPNLRHPPGHLKETN